MYLVKERLDKIFARMERVVFQNEGKALDVLREGVKQRGGAFDEDYLRKAAHIYLNSIRSLLTQFEKQYIKVMHIVDESFTEHRDMLWADIKERGNAYLERFGIFFLDSDANPEKYADVYMRLVDEVRNEYQKFEAKVFDALSREIAKEKNKKNLETLIYVGWGVAAVIVIFCVFYFGRNNDWTIEMDPEQWFNTQMQQIEGQVLSEDLDKALDQSDKLLEGFSPEKGPENYARLKKAQGDIFVKFAGMMQDKRREQLEKAVAAYEDAMQVVTPENMPVKNAQMNTTLGEACLGIPEVGQSGEGVGALVEQYGTDMEGLTAASQQVISLIDEKAYIERSIEAFKQSLDVYNQLRWPTENATVHVNLGIAYAMLSQMKQKVPNVRKAMTEFKTGIEYFTLDRYPLTYAIITNNIGVAYYYLCDFGEIEDLLVKAQKALKVAIQVLEEKGYKEYLYEVKLNEMRMRHQVEAMRLVRTRSFSAAEKKDLMQAMRTRFDEEEQALAKPAEPDQFASYEIEFMVLGVSKLKL